MLRLLTNEVVRKKAVVRVADCIRGLHEFVELAQLSAVNLNLAALVEVPGSTISLEVIQDMTKAVERVFAIIRGVAVAEHWLRENVHEPQPLESFY